MYYLLTGGPENPINPISPFVPFKYKKINENNNSMARLSLVVPPSDPLGGRIGVKFVYYIHSTYKLKIL